LPIVTLLAPFLSSDDKHSPPIRTSVVTAFATLLGVHSALRLYDSSINTLMLGVSTAVFLSKGLESCNEQASVEIPSQESFMVETMALGPPTVLVRFRYIAFFLTIMSAVSCLVLCPLCSFEQAFSDKWWQSVFTLAGIDGVRWILICILVTTLTKIANFSLFNDIMTYLSLQAAFALLPLYTSFFWPRGPRLHSKQPALSSFFVPILSPRPICRPGYRWFVTTALSTLSFSPVPPQQSYS
jgi:hypothetical protein